MKFLDTIRRKLTPPLLHSTAEKVWKNGRTLEDLERAVRNMQEAVGRIEARQTDTPVTDPGPEDLQSREFRVFSQWGEDGIIKHLMRHAVVPRKVFVEFGVEDYTEANTRFLLTAANWSGLVMDGDAANIQRICSSHDYWTHNLKAQHAFITAENINQLLHEAGVTGKIGLLSVDVDGMDYWIWRAIDAIEPAIVVCEYNHRFGSEQSVTVPYDPAFNRRDAHHSLIYYGASIRALVELADEKDYAFLGCGSHGLNAFFVHRGAMTPALREVSVEEGFVPGQFCETHDEAGNRVRTTLAQEQAQLAKLPLVDLHAEDPGTPTRRRAPSGNGRVHA
ncbi:MAG: hypothetical protein ACFCVE_14170 [Phycisphaerae bacterium]